MISLFLMRTKKNVQNFFSFFRREKNGKNLGRFIVSHWYRIPMSQRNLCGLMNAFSFNYLMYRTIRFEGQTIFFVHVCLLPPHDLLYNCADTTSRLKEKNRSYSNAFGRIKHRCYEFHRFSNENEKRQDEDFYSPSSVYAQL